MSINAESAPGLAFKTDELKYSTWSNRTSVNPAVGTWATSRISHIWIPHICRHFWSLVLLPSTTWIKKLRLEWPHEISGKVLTNLAKLMAFNRFQRMNANITDTDTHTTAGDKRYCYNTDCTQQFWQVTATAKMKLVRQRYPRRFTTVTSLKYITHACTHRHNIELI